MIMNAPVIFEAVMNDIIVDYLGRSYLSLRQIGYLQESWSFWYLMGVTRGRLGTVPRLAVTVDVEELRLWRQPCHKKSLRWFHRRWASYSRRTNLKFIKILKLCHGLNAMPWPSSHGGRLSDMSLNTMINDVGMRKVIFLTTLRRVICRSNACACKRLLLIPATLWDSINVREHWNGFHNLSAIDTPWKHRQHDWCWLVEKDQFDGAPRAQNQSHFF